MKRIMFILFLSAGFFAAPAVRSQTGPNYPGLIKYSLPLLTTVPPLYDSQPSDVASAYLWADELMRSTQWNLINKWIGNLGHDDTMTFLAEMLYKVSDDNPLSLYQWEISSWPLGGHPDYSWHYKGNPGNSIPILANQIGNGIGDTGRTGFILASDIIADVTIGDTIVKYNSSDNITPHIVLVNSTILDEIKGQKIPLCIGEDMHTHRKSNEITTMSYASTWPTYAVRADSGACIQFEYSPEWASAIAGDEMPFSPALSDSTGWWIRPGGEYIVFLRIAGIGIDTANGYFSIQPYWGVFGNQGAMYRVVSGHVVDPNDDFGLGASISGGLTVAVWKSRLRARIYNILHP